VKGTVDPLAVSESNTWHRGKYRHGASPKVFFQTTLGWIEVSFQKVFGVRKVEQFLKSFDIQYPEAMERSVDLAHLFLSVLHRSLLNPLLHKISTLFVFFVREKIMA